MLEHGIHSRNSVYCKNKKRSNAVKMLLEILNTTTHQLQVLVVD